MRSDFDNAFLEHIRLHRNESKKEIANWAFSYRQIEVDGLQKANDDLANGQCSLYKQHVELQKRVDAAIRVAQSIRKEIEHGHLSDEEIQVLSSYADELEQALKGDHA